MISRAETGKTKYGEPYVVLKLESNDAVLLKAYVSPDGKKLRIVLPELANFAQTRIDVDSYYVEFERDSLAARREVKEKR